MTPTDFVWFLLVYWLCAGVGVLAVALALAWYGWATGREF